MEFGRHFDEDSVSVVRIQVMFSNLKYSDPHASVNPPDFSINKKSFTVTVVIFIDEVLYSVEGINKQIGLSVLNNEENSDIKTQ